MGRKKKTFVTYLKKMDKGDGVKITAVTIDRKQTYDLLSGADFVDDLTALKSVIALCEENKIEYSLSAYCKALLKEGNKNE